MEIAEFDGLRKKIEDAKTKRARAEGSLSEALARLKKEFNCSDVTEAEARLKTIQFEIDADEAKLSTMLKELDGVTEWSKL